MQELFLTHIMIYIYIYTGRITKINILYLLFFTEGWVVRLHSSAAVCFRPFLLWDVTQHWLSVNLEGRTNRLSRNIGNQLPTKAIHHTGRVRAQGFGSLSRNLHLPVILHLLIFYCSSQISSSFNTLKAQ